MRVPIFQIEDLTHVQGDSTHGPKPYTEPGWPIAIVGNKVYVGRMNGFHFEIYKEGIPQQSVSAALRYIPSTQTFMYEDNAPAEWLPELKKKLDKFFEFKLGQQPNDFKFGSSSGIQVVWLENEITDPYIGSHDDPEDPSWPLYLWNGQPPSEAPYVPDWSEGNKYLFIGRKNGYHGEMEGLMVHRYDVPYEEIQRAYDFGQDGAGMDMARYRPSDGAIEVAGHSTELFGTSPDFEQAIREALGPPPDEDFKFGSEFEQTQLFEPGDFEPEVPIEVKVIEHSVPEKHPTTELAAIDARAVMIAVTKYLVKNRPGPTAGITAYVGEPNAYHLQMVPSMMGENIFDVPQEDIDEYNDLYGEDEVFDFDPPQSIVQSYMRSGYKSDWARGEVNGRPVVREIIPARFDPDYGLNIYPGRSYEPDNYRDYFLSQEEEQKLENKIYEALLQDLQVQQVQQDQPGPLGLQVDPDFKFGSTDVVFSEDDIWGEEPGLQGRIPLIYDPNTDRVIIGQDGQLHEELSKEFSQRNGFGAIGFSQMWLDDVAEGTKACIAGEWRDGFVEWFTGPDRRVPDEATDAVIGSLKENEDFKFGSVNVIDYRDEPLDGDERSHKEFVTDRTDNETLFLQYPVIAWYDHDHGNWSIAIGREDGFHREMPAGRSNVWQDGVGYEDVGINGRFTPPNDLEFYDDEFDEHWGEDPAVPQEIRQEMVAELNELLGTSSNEDFRFGRSRHCPPVQDRQWNCPLCDGPSFSDQYKNWLRSFPEDDLAHEKNLPFKAPPQDALPRSFSPDGEVLEDAPAPNKNLRRVRIDSAWFKRTLARFKRGQEQEEGATECEECGFVHKPGPCPKSKGGPMIMPEDPTAKERTKNATANFLFDKTAGDDIVPIWVNDDAEVVGSGRANFGAIVNEEDEFGGHSLYYLPSEGQVWIGVNSYVHHMTIERALDDGDLGDKEKIAAWTMYNRLVADDSGIANPGQLDVIRSVGPDICSAIGLPPLPPINFTDGQPHEVDELPGDFKFGSGAALFRFGNAS